MWFKKSSVQLSAAVVLALTTKDYITAGVFFTLGIFERMEEERIEQAEIRIDNDKEILSELSGYTHRSIMNLQNGACKIRARLRNAVEPFRDLD